MTTKKFYRGLCAWERGIPELKRRAINPCVSACAVNADPQLLHRHQDALLLHSVHTSQAFTSWPRRGLASTAILFLCSSFTGIRGLKNFGGWGENALKGLTAKAWGVSGAQPAEDKKARGCELHPTQRKHGGQRATGVPGSTKRSIWPSIQRHAGKTGDVSTSQSHQRAGQNQRK